MPYKDPEYHREYMREWYKRNSERIRQSTREWKKKNPEKVRECNRKWRERNPGHSKEWREKNPEKILRYRGRKNMLKRERTKSDPKFRLNRNMSRVIHFALKQNKAGRRWETFVGYTLKDLIEHLERLFTPEMSWNNYGDYWWIDHIKPSSSFNFKTAEDKEFKECWALENLQPLEAMANIKKSNYYPSLKSKVEKGQSNT